MPRHKAYENAAQAIGDTPMIKINRLIPVGQDVEGEFHAKRCD